MISIGLDVGKERDPAALAVLQTAGTRPDSHRPRWRVLEIGNLELGTPYHLIATRTVRLAESFVECGYPTVVTIDATGIGGAVSETARGCNPDLHIVDVTIGGGRVLTHNGPDEYTVGKHRLTEVLQVALEQQGLEIPDSDGAHLFRDQLGAFVRKPGRNGYIRHEAAGSGHDDLVLAAELAMWTGDHMFDQHAGVAP